MDTRSILRAIVPCMDLPKDDLGRDIVYLLTDHPGLRIEFGVPDLKAMTDRQKAALLDSMKTRLRIQPLRGRTLPYVGPGPDDDDCPVGP